MAGQRPTQRVFDEGDVRMGRDQIANGRFLERVIDEVVQHPHSPNPDEVSEEVFRQANEILEEINELVLQRTGKPWDPMAGRADGVHISRN